MKKIICNLRVVMAERGIKSISELQRITKLPRMTLDRVANNEATLIDCKTTERICEALNCDLTDLYKLVNQEEFNRIKSMNENARNNMRNGIVYFLKADNGMVKVGKTIDLERRINELNQAYNCDLVLVHSIKTQDSVSMEKRIHKAFAHKRVEGEWFYLNDDDVKIIKSMTCS